MASKQEKNTNTEELISTIDKSENLVTNIINNKKKSIFDFKAKTMSPYITTQLSTDILVQPQYLNENIYNNLKRNLITKLQGKCYRDYGYIFKIYQIKRMSDGIVVPENPIAGVSYNVHFSCRLCNPLVNREIICEVVKIKGMLINAINGPITVIIALDKINPNIFYHDTITNKLMVKSPDGKPHEIKQRTMKENGLFTSGSYVKILIESKKLYDGNNIIYAIGVLTGLANEEETKLYFDDEYATSDEDTLITNFDEYISGTFV